jgi:serine/threonine protein kinase
MASEDPQSAEGKVDADPLVGRVLDGKYAIVRLIARGGMGRIYEARQQPLGRKVALKVLRPPAEAGDEDFTQRFAMEAATLARLRHGNTVTLFDFGRMRDPDTHFIVMELVDGQTLAELLRSRSRAEPTRLLRIAVEVCRSLGEAHELGVVHRDLKPSNIMVVETHEGESVKVLDFGIAKLAEGDDDVTQAGRIIGSPRYMSPEQVRGDRVDGRSDIYALGVILYEGLTGKRLFGSHSQAAQLTAHLAARVRTFEEVGITDLPASVEAMVARCLTKDVAERYADVEELLVALRACLNDLGATVSVSLPVQLNATQSVALTAPVLTPDLSEPTLDAEQFAGDAPTSPRRLWVLLLSVVALAAAVLAWLAVSAAPTVVPPSVEQAPAQPAVAVSGPEVTQAPTLSLRSVPPGVAVWEGEVQLGLTPLEVPLDAARSRRVFVLRQRGFVEQQLVHEGARSSEREVVLQVAPAAPRGRPAVERPAPSPTQRVDDDLIMER